jgi:hypothetical protein
MSIGVFFKHGKMFLTYYSNTFTEYAKRVFSVQAKILLTYSPAIIKTLLAYF